MSLQILENFNNCLCRGNMFHDELQDLFEYLSLDGYATMNHYQFITERLYQKKIKRLITSTYNVVSKNMPQDVVNILSLVKNKNRKQLTVDERCNIIKTAFIEYENFERNNLIEYENIAKTLSNNNEMALYSYVLEKVKAVEEELSYISQFILSHETMSWDLPQVISEQTDIQERYVYLLRKLYKKFPKFHHFNACIGSEDEV